MTDADYSEPTLQAKSQIRDGERLAMESRYSLAAWAFREAAAAAIEAAQACEAMARERAERDA